MDDQDPPLNPSQHVERIREILVGRQMHDVDDRLHQLEVAHSAPPEKGTVQRIKNSQAVVIEQTQELRKETESCRAQLEQLREKVDATCRELKKHDQELQANLSAHLESISAAMASRIDDRVGEVLEHLQAELGQWKENRERELQSIREASVSRTELKNRFARLATAAMEDDPPVDDDGFLL